MSGAAYERAVLHQAAAHCLVYPDGEFRERLPLVTAAVDGLRGRPARLLRPFLEHAAATPPGELAAHYVEVFDFRGRHCLHLTWWREGDTRRRGAALVRLKEAYRAHGLAVGDDELPDFLPVVLEFTAATGCTDLLTGHRPGVELLRIALAEAGTPYAHVLAAVCATLPGPSPRDRAEARALARSGPGREDVGLEPYGRTGPTATANGAR